MKRDFTNEDAVMETLRHNIRRRRPSDGPGLLMSLMMCEAIIDRKSLQAATSIKALAYETSSGARLSWQIDGWIDARYLSSSSLQRIQARGPIVGAQDWEELEQAINQLFGITLDELMESARAWWSHRLPGDLYQHATRQRPYQVLSRESLARRETKLVVTKSASSASDQTLGLATLAQQTPPRPAPWLSALRRAISRIATTRQPSDTATKAIRAAVDACQHEAASCGHASFLAWVAIDTLTSRSRNAAFKPRTLVEYIRFVEQLATHLSNRVDLEAMDGESWLQVYESIIRSNDASQRRTCRVVFDHIHVGFVSLGVDWIPRSLSQQIGTNVPRNLIIWDHEYERAIAYVSATEIDPVVREQAVLIIRLGWHIPLRINDILSLRLRDLAETPSGLTLSIAAPSEHGGPKTRSTRRSVDLPEGPLADALASIHHRRHGEGAAPSDGLFSPSGLPDRWTDIGLTLRLVSMALREATGDPAITFYALRHTAINRRRVNIDSEFPRIDLPVDAQIAEFAGHGDTNSWASYFHQPDDLLKRHCRKVIHEFSVASETSTCVALRDLTFNVSLALAPPSIQIGRGESVKSRTFQQYLAIGNDLVSDFSDGEIAARHRLSRRSLEVFTSSLIAQLPDFKLRQICRLDAASSRSVLFHCQPWVRAATQAKYAPLIRSFDRLLETRDSHAIRELEMAWRTLRRPTHIEIGDNHASEILMRYLQSSGLRDSLRLGCRSRSTTTAEWARTYPVVRFRSRTDQPQYHLIIAGCGSVTRGRGMSVVGLHWLFIVLSAAECMQEAKNHE